MVEFLAIKIVYNVHRNRFVYLQETSTLEQIAYVNGSFVPLSEAKVSVLDRGFLFADGIYEVAAVLDGKLIDNASHLARLERSVGEISLPLPESVERIQEIQKELVERNNLVNGMVYLEVTRGADTGRDFAFPKNVKPTLIMFTSVKDIVNAPSATTGINVITVPDLRWTRRDIKSVALCWRRCLPSRPRRKPAPARPG